MTWLAALGLLKRFGSFLGGLNIWQLACIGLALFAGLQTIRVSGEKRHSAKVETQLAKCSQARHADQQAYRKAQADAQAKNAAHVAAENKLREQISEESHRDFVADRDRLRSQSAAPKGAAGGSGLPGVPKAAPGTPSEVLPLPPAELLRAQELELQLNALIDWVIQQSKIDPGAGK